MLSIKPINNENCNFCLKFGPTYEVKGKSRLVVNICQDCLNSLKIKTLNPKNNMESEPKMRELSESILRQSTGILSRLNDLETSLQRLYPFERRISMDQQIPKLDTIMDTLVIIQETNAFLNRSLDGILDQLNQVI